VARQIRLRRQAPESASLDHVSYEDLREALSAYKGARTAVQAAAMVYGMVVTDPSISADCYLYRILPPSARDDDPAVDRIARLLMALHRIVLTEIIKGKTPCLRPDSYEATKAGLIQQCDDLLGEMGGFLLGIMVGSEGNEDEVFPDACQKPLNLITTSQDVLMFRRKQLTRRRKPMTEQEVFEQQSDLEDFSYHLSEWKFALAQGMRNRRILLDERSKPAPVGRNEPCPCGSGKKYKHCCPTRTS
jgi:hypothetical protein